MSQQIAKNTFIKGMNLDADISVQPNGTYREANNVRITVNEDSTMGAIENIKGNELLISSQFETANEVILGSTTIDSDLILFTLDSTDTYSRIYRFIFDGDTISSYSLLWTDSGKAEEDRLNLDSTMPLKIVSRKEAENIEKIYWVDNTNYLRYANIAEYLTTDGLIKSGSNDYISAKSFNTVSDVTFTEPVLSSSGGGGLNSGVVQYSYQLYNKNGSESSFSPATGLYHLSSSSDNASDNRNYKGNPQGEESGKSFTFNITLNNYAYNSIRIVSIHYDYYSQLPTINIINEKAIPSTGVVTFTDRGTDYIGSYTIEQFTAIAGLYKAKDIASSKNFLFLANTTENSFDIGDYDARAYRFRALDLTCTVVESNGYIYVFNPDGSWLYRTPEYVTVDSGTDWDIPMNADTISYYNNPSNDGAGATWAKFKYKADGTTLGGEGKNISYTFNYELITLDDSDYVYTLRTADKDSKLGFNNYCSPNNTANKRGYQRDETYRYGIVFFDKYGRESVVKWIGDIRMPNLADTTYLAAKSITGGKCLGKVLTPIFTVKNYPTGAVSYKIVRVERGTEDKSIIASGLLRPTLLKPGGANNRMAFHARPDDSMDLPNWAVVDLQEFISPEISFYKNLQVLGDDYIEVHDVHDVSYYNTYSHNVSHGDEKQIKVSTIDAASSDTKLEIASGEIVKPLLEDEIVSIAEFSFYSWFDGDDGEAGIKGTSLIFKPETATNIYGTFSNTKYTEEYIRYGIYKRNIFNSQYGGNTYSARSNNEYISASSIKTIPSNLAASSVEANQGDTFIAMHEQMAISNARSKANVFLNFMFPVETSINLQLRHDDRYSTVYNPSARDYKNLREEGVADGTNNYSEMYLYNTAYSQENTLKKYFPLPEGEEFEEFKTYNTRIIVSEKKFNGEESDSWLTFLTNNFIDVDANYGEIINIEDHNNNLLFWQPKAFGNTDVDPRSLITDNNPGALVLGTGVVLSRFDYLSTMTGCTDEFGVVKTPKGFYWFDNINNLITKYDNKSILRISKLNGIQSFLNENNFTESIATYDMKHDEVLFTLTGGTGNDNTVVFNELVGVFTGFYSYIPTQNIIVDNRLLSTENNNDLYIHDTSTSSYCKFYDDVVPWDSTVKIPINDKPDIVKVFDVFNFPTYLYDNSDNLIYNETFDSIRCYNSFQNTDYIDLTPDTNISRKKGLWSFNNLRNAVNKNPSTNPDIFNTSNLDKTQTYKSRMRDLYLVTDLTYNNSSNYRLKFPYIHTKYRANFR